MKSSFIVWRPRQRMIAKLSNVSPIVDKHRIKDSLLQAPQTMLDARFVGENEFSQKVKLLSRNKKPRQIHSHCFALIMVFEGFSFYPQLPIIIENARLEANVKARWSLSKNWQTRKNIEARKNRTMAEVITNCSPNCRVRTTVHWLFISVMKLQITQKSICSWLLLLKPCVVNSEQTDKVNVVNAIFNHVGTNWFNIRCRYRWIS